MKETLQFLEKLAKNNNRQWFADHKAEWEGISRENKTFFNQIFNKLQDTDCLGQMHIPRIYRDTRFSKNLPPFKGYTGVKISRMKPTHRGSYFINIEPNKCFVAGGFWAPEKEDLLRIRQEFEFDFSPMQEILSKPLCKQYFGSLQGEEGVKTAPKGFDKHHPAIKFIKKKQFLLQRPFTNEEVCADNFAEDIIKTCLAIRPFLEYMSEVLTTNLNGEPLF